VDRNVSATCRATLEFTRGRRRSQAQVGGNDRSGCGGMQDEAAGLENRLHVGKARLDETGALLTGRHVEPIVGLAAGTAEMIADQVSSTRGQEVLDSPVKRKVMALVAQFVNRLMGDYTAEPTEAIGPAVLAKAALDERQTIRKVCETSPCPRRAGTPGCRGSWPACTW
jgi:hypothetical protein